MAAPWRRERGIDGSGKTNRAYNAVKEGEEGSPKGGRAALETPGFANSEALSHEQPQVEPGDVDKHALRDVLATTKMRAAHTAGLQRVRKAALDELASIPHQALTAGASDPAPIAVDHIAFDVLATPMLPPPPRLGDVRPEALHAQRKKHRLAVIALVGNDLFDTVVLGRVLARVLAGIIQILLGGCHGRRHRGGVALRSPVDGHRDDRSRIHVDGVLLLVRQVRASVLHLRDLRIRIIRVCPLVIRAFLLPLPIQARQVLARGRRYPRRLGQVLQEALITPAVVSPHDRASPHLPPALSHPRRSSFP